MVSTKKKKCNIWNTNYLNTIKKDLDISLNPNKSSKIYEYEIKAAIIYDLLTDEKTYETELSNKPIIQNEKGREYVITEYMGPGCPDMLSRELWMAINNKRYLVAVKATIDSVITYDSIVEIYAWTFRKMLWYTGQILFRKYFFIVLFHRIIFHILLFLVC